MVVVAVGGWGPRGVNVGERWRENMLPERIRNLNLALDTPYDCHHQQELSVKSKPVV